MKATFMILGLLTLAACNDIKHPTCKVYLESNLSPMALHDVAQSLWLKGFEFEEIVSSGDKYIAIGITKNITKLKNNQYSCKVSTLVRYREAGSLKYYKFSKDKEFKYSSEEINNCEQDFVAAFEPLVPTCEITSQN